MEGDRDGRPFFFLALKVYCSSMNLGDVLDDRQAQAGTTGLFRTALVDAIESFKDLRLIFFRYADAAVLNGEFDLFTDILQ